jgi:hypothetical protein
MSRLFRGRRLLQKQLRQYAIAEGVVKGEVADGDVLDLGSFRAQKAASGKVMP